MSSSLRRGQAPVGGGPRGRVAGWSVQAARRNAHWLQSADWGTVDTRTAAGVAFTGTVRKMPTAGEWRARMLALVQWATRTGGVELMHWCVEFQRRGAPHVHAAMFGDAVDPDAVVEVWLRLNPGTLPVGQDCKALGDGHAWAVYVSKHAQRGVGHYQRSRAMLEAAGRREASWFSESAGRMWGIRGDWPMVEALTLEQVEGGADFATVVKRWSIVAGVVDPPWRKADAVSWRGCGGHGRPGAIGQGVILHGDRGDVRADTLEQRAVELGMKPGPFKDTGYPLWHQAYWELTSGDGKAGMVEELWGE